MPSQKTLMCIGGAFPAFWYILGRGVTQINSSRVIEGYSSGALAAVVILFFSEVGGFDKILNTGMKVKYDLDRAGVFGYPLRDLIYNFLEKLLPCDAHIRVRGRLGILISSIYLKGVIIRDWLTRDDLIQCVVASCFIPGIVGWSLSDKRYNSIDGGFARNMSELCKGKELLQCPINSTYINQFFFISGNKAPFLYNLGLKDGIMYNNKKLKSKHNCKCNK
jgi:hypothetical protein